VCVCVCGGGNRWKLRTNPGKFQVSYSVSTHVEHRPDCIKHAFLLHICVIRWIIYEYNNYVRYVYNFTSFSNLLLKNSIFISKVARHNLRFLHLIPVYLLTDKTL
jgi:hypothetical protein